MRILITGANGQVGSALRRLLPTTAHEVTYTDRAELDLSDATAVREFTLALKPHVVVNVAAYTAVDKAETEPLLAKAINEDAVRVLAEATQDRGATLFHLSSDYVYHNGLDRPLRETDPAAPKSVYARTKLAGDEAALAGCERTYVLRTSWVYGLEGHNFVRTMARLGKERERLNVVSDQIGAPTFADDVAAAISSLIGRTERNDAPAYGIYNFAGEGVASWYDFARAIMQGYELSCQVCAIRSDQYPTPAARPSYSVLDLSKARTAGLPLRHWRDALVDFLERDTTMAAS